MFDVADQFVSRTAGASVRGLIDYVATLQLPTAGAESMSTERVSVLTSHAALGRQWDLVVIAGLQEGLWPNTVPRGGVLGTQRLLDAIDGVGDDASMRAPLLAEERRLLVAAMGRARSRLLLTAVDGETAVSGIRSGTAVAILIRDRTDERRQCRSGCHATRLGAEAVIGVSGRRPPPWCGVRTRRHG